MTKTPREIVRPGGRRVATHDLTPDAPVDAPVVLFAHAAPGSGGFDPDPRITAAHGVRLVSLDRPGYGGSDPIGDAYATVDSAADDAAALLEAVLPSGATAGVAGWSAGGRVALALAARRPDLVHAVAVIGTPAPDDRVPWVPPEHRAGVEALRELPPAAAHAALAEVFGPMFDGPPGPQRLAMIGADSPADADVLARPGVAERVGAMLDAAVAQGAAGTAADIVGYTLRPWGFDPADVAAPVLLGYGDADERVPPAHGEWYAGRLPQARLELVAGLGHLAVVPFWERALNHLRAGR